MIWGYQFHSFFAILSMHLVFFLYRIQNCDEKCHFLRPMVLGITLGWSGSRQDRYDQWSKASDNGASKEPTNPESVKRFFGTILVNHWAGCWSGRSHSVYRDMLCSQPLCVAYTIDNRPWQYRLLFLRLLVTILVPRSHSRDHVCAFAQSYAGKTQDHVRSNNKSYSLYVYQSSGLIHYKPGRRKIREYTIQVKVSERIRNTSKTLQGKKIEITCTSYDHW